MKLINPFFKKKKKVLLSEIFKILGKKYKKKDHIIENISDLKSANIKDVTFFNSLKYLEFLKKTKSKYIITNKKYENITGKYSNPIIVENVLKSVAVITNLYYPDALDDAVDFSLIPPDKKKIP